MTTVCEYPSQLVAGERIRVECIAGHYELCRLDRRGRRIRCMTVAITPAQAEAHAIVAKKRSGEAS